MFEQNIFIKKITKARKIAIIVSIIIITANIILGTAFVKPSYAVQERLEISDKLDNYPAYTELINNLKKLHPNWKFKILYTELDWNQVIKNESTAWHGRNLVDSSKTGDWICPICQDKSYDNGSWRCASEATVSYYMDPRNFLNDDYIFQFEESVFNENIHTTNGVMAMTQGTFLAGTDNANAIVEACKKVNINPYQVVSRLLQEQGYYGSTMSKGNNGWYNVFNVGATGNSSSEIIANATEYAKNNGWDTLAKSILGGIDFLKSKYIGIGQNTFYLQKFDVDNSDGILYYHQYMQNVSAAYTESQTVRNIYRSTGVFNNNISFVIPVYENMPKERSPIPGTQSLVTQNVKIKDNKINVRELKNTSSKSLAELNSGDILLRIEVGNTQENGFYWDKVVLPNGTKGYIASNLIEKINDVTNCNETVIVNTSVNLRNGPGTKETSIITTLIEGQALTRIETGKYNGLDGYNWDRVLLSDGRQGYIVSTYVDKLDNNTNSNTGELIKITSDIGLTIREEPGTDKRVLTYASYQEIVTRIQKDVSNANGYTWDKIVTGSGIVGYIARGNDKEQFVEVVNNSQNSADNNANNSNTKENTTNNNFKLEEEKIITEPNTTVEKIKEEYPDAKITKDGKEVQGAIGTNYVINLDGKEYHIIKFGDIDGNTVIDAIDLLKIRKYLLGKEKIEGNFATAMDVYKDGVIDAKDLLKLRKVLTKAEKIQVN